MRQRVPANAEPLITRAYQSEDASLIAPDTTGKKINHCQRAAKRACEDPEVHMTARLSAAANHPDAANRIPRVVRVKTNAVNLNYTKRGSHCRCSPWTSPGANWDESIRKMSDCFRKVREETANCFTYEDLHHHRGNFASINYGNSFGAGQRVFPSMPSVLSLYLRLASARLTTKTDAFGPNFPQEFTHYKVILGELYKKNTF
ncbi:hypothetical protein B0H10DRAFT_1959004 [Mycena sp. CBHHK59/15]|nr:hypothetical protein B0H10DRAFT_1959004 [Mycena sp. CBHHK59/15]